MDTSSSQNIISAWEVLKDPVKRSNYDTKLKGNLFELRYLTQML